MATRPPDFALNKAACLVILLVFSKFLKNNIYIYQIDNILVSVYPSIWNKLNYRDAGYAMLILRPSEIVGFTWGQRMGKSVALRRH